ncbi:septal ring lytic transglycosylase RlpA family protein [Bradyrhizobium sp. USDA 4353]
MRIIDRTERPEQRDTCRSLEQGGSSGIASRLLRLTLVCAAAASLAACAQSSAVRQARIAAPTKQAAVEFRPQVQRAEAAPESVVRVRHAEASPPAAHSASSGLASYYSEGRKTASGERFDPSELTAAHRSLPFGTRLQVTNVKTGRSVVVRVNDRGPFVQGRVVDVSYSAAQALGMVNTGVAPVKVSVVR